MALRVKSPTTSAPLQPYIIAPRENLTVFRVQSTFYVVCRVPCRLWPRRPCRHCGAALAHVINSFAAKEFRHSLLLLAPRENYAAAFYPPMPQMTPMNRRQAQRGP
jgi:hypothetical protein